MEKEIKLHASDEQVRRFGQFLDDNLYNRIGSGNLEEKYSRAYKYYTELARRWDLSVEPEPDNYETIRGSVSADNVKSLEDILLGFSLIVEFGRQILIHELKS